MMKSKVQQLASQKGIKNPQELSYAAHITWPTANSVWPNGIDLTNTRGGTLLKLSRALDVRIDDLFEFEPA